MNIRRCSLLLKRLEIHEGTNTTSVDTQSISFPILYPPKTSVNHRFLTFSWSMEIESWLKWVSYWVLFFKVLEHFVELFDIKVGLSPFEKKFFICFNDSPSKMMKNASDFILKAFFVLKLFRFLSWLFRHVEKTAWLER